MGAQVRYVDGQAERLDPEDRGLAYGDGLFETMAARDGQVRWLDYHLERLGEGCRRLAIPLPDFGELRARILARAPRRGAATVKLILTRGAGPRGYAPPPAPVPTVVLLAYPGAGAPSNAPVTVRTLRLRLAENPKLAGIKHLCRLEQVLAQLELGRRKAEEGLLLDTSGHVVGATSSNVFAAFGSRLATPRIARAGVCGVMRRVVLERASGYGLQPEEADLAVEDLIAADEVFVTNALIGIRPVRRLDDKEYGEHPIAQGLCEDLGLNVEN